RPGLHVRGQADRALPGVGGHRRPGPEHHAGRVPWPAAFRPGQLSRAHPRHRQASRLPARRARAAGRGRRKARHRANRAMTDDADQVLPQGTGRPAAIPGPIFAAAVDTFVAGQRLDMRSLARRTGVARATLYRRAGNREQLLDQVLWWRARLLLAGQVRASAGLTGTDRLAAAIGGVLRAIGTDRPVRMFLESDPETARRVLTGSRSTVHQGMAAALENLIDLERGRGAFDASLDTPTLAFAIVRVADGFLYTGVIADRASGMGRAVIAIEALLRGLGLVRRSPVSAGRRRR